MFQILSNLLKQRGAILIRFIPAAGFQKVCWIYYSDRLGKKYATFISMTDLIRAFSWWLEQVELINITLWQRIAIDKANWQLLEVGEKVFHRLRNSLGKIIWKGFDRRKLPVIKVNWGEKIETLEPCYLEIF
jgi:hypothetical protein